MSGTSIGEVSINLRMSLAQFKTDTRNGTTEATRASKEMSAAFRDQSREAKASLALIGEEIGISIPRHLRGLIATIPGVGSALAAAFNSVAVIALLGIVVEIAKKIQELGAASEKTAEQWKKLNEQIEDMTHKGDPLASTIGSIGENLTKATKEAANESTVWKALNGVIGNVVDGFLLANPAIGGVTEMLKKGDATAQAFSADLGTFFEKLKKVEKDQGPQAALALINLKLADLSTTADGSIPHLEDVFKALKNVRDAIGTKVEDDLLKSAKDSAEAATKAIDKAWTSYQQFLKIQKQSSIRNVTDTALALDHFHS